MIRTLRPGLRCVEVPNGDVMDDPTNMFIIGENPVVLIDPGSMPGLDTVVDTLNGLGNPVVSEIWLTHVHIDHGESANEVRRHTGAPIRFHELELPELHATPHDIELDGPIATGEILKHTGYAFEAVLTPGHAAGHLSFVETSENFAIVGDLVTGWGSSAIFPPWGDLADYIDSLQLMARRGTNPLYPSHGEPVENGPEALQRFVHRRLERERQILEILNSDPLPAEKIRDQLYGELPQDLINDVTGNVILHLEKLERQLEVQRIDAEGSVLYRRC